jgi:hypothetical protein
MNVRMANEVAEGMNEVSAARMLPTRPASEVCKST